MLRRPIVAVLAIWPAFLPSQSRAQVAAGPDPKEIPVPEIVTSLRKMPGVAELPERKGLPDVMVMNDGARVTTAEQWEKRRAEMKKILEYYAVGLAPPPPGNVKGVVEKELDLLGGKEKYRLVKLTFGPEEKLSLEIGIFTPADGAKVPVVIMPGGTPPGGTWLEQLPQGPGQGKGTDALLVVGPRVGTESNPGGGTGQLATRPAGGARTPIGIQAQAEALASRSPAIAHGFALVVFNNGYCAEDTTLRMEDGSWAFRTTRFFPAYPGYDWGVLRAWAWGVSRIVDYLQTDATVDSKKIIVTGVSRTGKSALIAGAFDERIAMVAPCASSGGGTPAYRFSGADRGGNEGPGEGLSEMMKKYPNWFSPHLHEFWGQADKLPFDNHWLIALAAPRPFIALEGRSDQNVNKVGLAKSWLGAQPAFEFAGDKTRLGVSWSQRPHGMNQGDWDAMLAFADRWLLGKTVERTFDELPVK